MHFFYYPFESEADFEMSGSEARHCSTVLRCKTGDTIKVTNGKGSIATAIISAIKKDAVALRILELDKKQLPEHKLTLVIPPLKNPDRTEWLLEKATEIGVHCFQFVITRHCVSKKVNLDRMQRVITAAVKQSEKHFIPELPEVVNFEKFVQNCDGNIIMATCAALPKYSMHELDLKGNVHLLIGPEGDFSKEEIDMALNKKAAFVTLGTERLRSETAALTAVVLYNFIAK